MRNEHYVQGYEQNKNKKTKKCQSKSEKTMILDDVTLFPLSSIEFCTRMYALYALLRYSACRVSRRMFVPFNFLASLALDYLPNYLPFHACDRKSAVADKER